MKKKVLYGVTLALLGGASMVSLQSCKDDLSDLEHRVNFDENQNATSLKELWDFVRDDNNSIDKRIDALDTFMNLLNDINDGNFPQAFEDYKEKVNDLYADMYGEEGVLAKLGDLESSVSDINDAIGDINGAIGDINGTLGDINDALGGINQRLENLDKAVEGIPELEQAVENIKKDIEDLTKETNNVVSQMDALIERVDNLITGIIIQRAFGPAFGDFSLPIGVQSNMLFNWYGENIGNLDNFPTADPDEAAALGVNFAGFTTVPVDYNEVNLGDLYLTINPINHKYDGTKFSLITSDGTQLDPEQYKLIVEASNDKLMFGSRASEAVTSPLYKANLKVASSEIEPIKVNISEEKLKTVVKNAAKDPSLLTAAQLVKAVYDQLNENAPASYAVRYDWTAPTGNLNETTGDQETQTYSVISNFDLAVATARPLSYNALKGISSSKELPTGHLANFIEKLKEKALDKITVNTETKVGNYTVKVGEISFKTEDDQLVGYVKGMTVDGNAIVRKPSNARGFALNGGSALVTENGEIKVYCGMEPDNAVELVNEAIVQVLINETKNEGNEAFKAEAQLKLDAVLLEMNNQINDIVAQIRGNIGSAFDSLENSNYFSLANRAFNLYNRVASKINNFLANPNAYLQVAAFYETSDDLGILSQVAKQPTPFTGNGEAINIYLSSYTGEFLAPAYKKFFACTGIVGETSADVSAINTGKLGTVLEGSETEISIPVKSLEKGKVYEFVYQGLDYSGYTSTKKFYIEVK